MMQLITHERCSVTSRCITIQATVKYTCTPPPHRIAVTATTTSTLYNIILYYTYGMIIFQSMVVRRVQYIYAACKCVCATIMPTRRIVQGAVGGCHHKSARRPGPQLVIHANRPRNIITSSSIAKSRMLDVKIYYSNVTRAL